MTVNPLVAARVEGPKSAWAGVWIAEDIELVAQGVENGNWIDGTLGVVSAGLDALAMVSDPVGALLQYGIAWLIEHVKPLSEALDWLAGDPAQITAQAQTWRNVAESLRSQSDDLVKAVRWDLTEWSGGAADAYRSRAGQHQQSLQALAKAADAMSLMTEGAGMLIGTVRVMVRDAVATVVSRLIVYAGELLASFGLATPVVVEQVSTLCASWAAKISHWLKSLISSIRRLGDAMRRLGHNIDELAASFKRGDVGSRAGHEPMFSRNAPRTNRDVLENGPGTPRDLDNVNRMAEQMGIDLGDVDVKLIDDPEEVRYLDHMDACAYTPGELNGAEVRLGPASFADEETLAATIAHEYKHVLQQRAGEHLRRPISELEDEAYAVEGPALERFRGGNP
jgi:uncharacterized protein YukE